MVASPAPAPPTLPAGCEFSEVFGGVEGFEPIRAGRDNGLGSGSRKNNTGERMMTLSAPQTQKIGQSQHGISGKSVKGRNGMEKSEKCQEEIKERCRKRGEQNTWGCPREGFEGREREPVTYGE